MARPGLALPRISQNAPLSRMASGTELQRLEQIRAELGHVAARQQQLRDREALLLMLLEFRSSNQQSATSKRKQASEEGAMQAELGTIREELEKLKDQEEALQEQNDKILYSKGRQEDVKDIVSMGGVFVLPQSDVLDVAPPPSYPAPQIILDVNDLPPQPAHTLCPSCHQYITTETLTRVGSVAWLVCAMSFMFGCVAGCCLIPFCLDTFKDVEHRCPKCHSQIYTSRKL